MTWTTTPPTRLRSSSIWTSATPSISDTPPAAGKSPAMSPAMARAGSQKAVLMSAVPPIMVKSPKNADGLPIEVFDDFRKKLAANRAQFYHEIAAAPFYGFNRPGAKPLEGVIENWWRQGMMGGAKAHYDGIKAFSETDLTEDLKNIDVPTLVMQGDDDQIVPYIGAALLQVQLLRNATLKLYPGFPHGMLTTYADTINQDLLAFIRS